MCNILRHILQISLEYTIILLPYLTRKHQHPPKDEDINVDLLYLRFDNLFKVQSLRMDINITHINHTIFVTYNDSSFLQ